MSTDDITRETRIAAPPQRVWDVITRPEHVGRWFGDAGADIDLRPGGAMRLTWSEHGTALGRVEQVQPITLFSFRWTGERDTEPAPGNATLVEFHVHPDGDGTRLVVTESGFADLDKDRAAQESHREDNVGGWSHEMNDLVEYLEKLTV
jgi:uncharacterized protein YndB with AHSA1/START domain